MSRHLSMPLLALVAGLCLVSRANAVNTLTGIIRDCNNNPVSGVTVYQQNVPYPSGTCSVSWSGRSGFCSVTDATGRYTLTFPSEASTMKLCAVAVPEDDGWPGCSYNCVNYKCCGGQHMIATTGSVTVPAGADNQTFTVNLNMNYAGSCYPNTPPENLFAINCTMNSIQLAWNGPSDGGCPAIAYDMRYSTSPITESNWPYATQASGEPGPGVHNPQMWVTGLSPCTNYYFAVKGQLHSFGWSTMSNTVGAGTKCSPIGPCEVDAVTFETDELTAPALALGAIRPNPAPRGEFEVSFTLANDSPGVLDLLDVVGRRVETHDLSGLGTGDHTLRIGTRGRLSPGLYWVRLRQGEHKLMSRAFVVR